MNPEPLACRGAPRDLGLDQGRAFPAEIRREVRRRRGWANPFAARDARTQRLQRDLQRYYPHMAERAAGLARGARLARRHLAALMAPELADREEDRVYRAGAGAMVAVAPERSGAGPLIARCLDLPRDRSRGFELRRSEPDADYVSLEVVLPWLIAPVAGVNEHGLAVAVTSVPGSGRAVADCAAPATLLAQDCLQRFDSTEKAVEWCERRPAGGATSILLADARGDVASVVVEGERRWVCRPSDGLLLGLARTLRRNSIEKGCLARERCDLSGLAEIFSSHDGTARGDDDSPCRHGKEQESVGLVVLDPTARTLHLLDAPPCERGRSFRSSVVTRG